MLVPDLFYILIAPICTECAGAVYPKAANIPWKPEGAGEGGGGGVPASLAKCRSDVIYTERAVFPIKTIRYDTIRYSWFDGFDDRKEKDKPFFTFFSEQG